MGRYCGKCGYEICEEGDVITMYPGKKTCNCLRISKSAQRREDVPSGE